jgi:hypothetical protein
MSEKENWLKAITDTAARRDGEAFVMTLHTEAKYPLRVNLTPEDVESFIRHLLTMSEVAGSYKGIDPVLSVGDQVNVSAIPVHNAAAMLSPSAASVVLVFRFGTLDLAFDVPASNLLQLGRQIAELAARMGSEPHTVQ